MAEQEFTLKLPTLTTKANKRVSFAVVPPWDNRCGGPQRTIFAADCSEDLEEEVEDAFVKHLSEITGTNEETCEAQTVTSQDSQQANMNLNLKLKLKSDNDNVKVDREYLENSMFMGAHMPSTQTLAQLSWRRYCRSKEDIRSDLRKSLARCKNFFANVGMKFDYRIGDSDYKRRGLRNNWRERRKTGIISTDTEQDEYEFDQNKMEEVDNHAKILAHRGKMTVMITEYQKRMVQRLKGLEDLNFWIARLEEEDVDEYILDELDDFIDTSYDEFTKGRHEAKEMIKQMRRLLKKMAEKHQLLQNRLKVTSKLKQRAAMAYKNIVIDYSNMETINNSFEQLINRQLVFLTMSKKLSKEAQDNDEKLRKIQQYMTRCVKELSSAKESLFHRNHILSNEKQKLTDKCKLQQEQLDFYENKEGFMKHQATVAASKTVDAMKIELEHLTQKYDKVVGEEDALKAEVQELHQHILKYEVDNGNIMRESTERLEKLQRIELILKEERRRNVDLGEEFAKLQDSNLKLRIENETKPDMTEKSVSIQSLEPPPRSPPGPTVNTQVLESEEPDSEVVYVDQRAVESYEVATDTSDLNSEMKLTSEKNFQTDPIEFAEDKRRGITNPFETDLMAGNSAFLDNVTNNRNRVDVQQDESPGNKPVARSRVADTPGYTQMIVKRLKEERQNDINRLSDYIKRERARTEATSRKLTKEHKRAITNARREIKAIALQILRYRDKFVNQMTKQNVTPEGLTHPTVAELKGDNVNAKTKVSMKHTVIEILNCIDFNLSLGLKEIHIRVKETVNNQKTTQRELALKNKKLERTNKAVETLESRMQQLRRDGERIRLREQYTNERYRELLKREEELERAEEAHVIRIEERLSELWTKSTTEIGNDLDGILEVKKKKPLTETQLRRQSRPHRPRDRLMNTVAPDTFASETGAIDDSLEDVIESETNSSSEDETQMEDETKQLDDNDRNGLRIEMKIRSKEEQSDGICENENEQVDNQVLSENKGTLHKGSVIANQDSKCESEWSENKTEELKRYIKDIQTIKPATITHPGDGKFLHFDSCVAKIDEMYQTILNGRPLHRRQRRDAAIGSSDPTVMHYKGHHMTEMQLTIQAVDQIWNVGLLRSAYENKAIGIRMYSNALDLVRRNLALKGARFKMLSQRMSKVQDLAAVQSLLLENEDEDVEEAVVSEVLSRTLPELHTRLTRQHLDKVQKLARLNTYILAEQVRVFQQIRDCELAMRLRFPYPVMEGSEHKLIPEKSGRPVRRGAIAPNKSLKNIVKVDYPVPMESVLTTTGVGRAGEDHAGHKMWRNPTLVNTRCPESEPMSYTLVLDCNALRPYNDTTLPMAKLNPHSTIPPIIQRTLEETKPSSASFTLPLVQTFSSDSGYDGSNVVLDPSKYM